MHPLIKPNKLKPGDTVAAITLSWGGAKLYPYRYKIGKKRLKDIFELNVVATKHTTRDPEWLYNNPRARADDLMEPFNNLEIKGIFSIIGGDDSVRLLPYLDYDVIYNNPKIFLGFSETTVTHFACLKAGLSTFCDPAILTAFAENLNMHHYSIESLQKNLFMNEIIGEIAQNHESWTGGYIYTRSVSGINWKITSTARELYPPEKWRFLSGTEVISVP